ncbi:SfiI-subtelomeric fragment related protein family member, putative [Theileria annulata]|uniref:SfiI-subtelomeric related protein family member, putative n=1 Tax=Theileria annulata TaxID=5874 RepID=Q4UFW4_THEAN|nr:SfiI-subtelomeric fragment related protein family member, putative [Theileria annulata]CAI74025.1 SfiI-subtelomeric fragment related protein family member, putative [Theileria annulata]
MKKWIISLNLLYYITFFHQWNFVESQPVKGASTTPDSAESSDTSSVSHVTLDVNSSQSTNDFEYLRNAEFRTFTPKAGHVFSKVMMDNAELWSAKPGDHALKAVLMGSGNKPKHLALLLQSGNFVLLYNSDMDKPWDDLTADKQDVTKLKFLGDNDAELTKSDYKVDLVDLSFTFAFNTGVVCKKVTYSDTPLWSHSDDSKFASLKSLALDLAKDKFFVKNSSDETKELTKAKVTVDLNATQSTNEFEYSEQNGVVTYTPKSCRVFNKVMDATKVVCQSSDDVYGTLVRTKTVDSVKFLVVLLDNHMFKLFHLDSGEWHDLTKDRLDVSKLRFFGENGSELKSSNLEVSLVDLSYTFTFKSNVKCRMVKLLELEVWKHCDDSAFGELKSLHLDLPSNKLFVKNSSDESKELSVKVALDVNVTESTDKFDFSEHNGLVTFTPKPDHVFSKVSQGTTVVWESSGCLYGSLVMSKTKAVKFLAVLMTNSSFSLFHLDDGNWKDVTSMRHDVTKLKFYGENDSVLSSSDFEVMLVNLSYTYMFNDASKCKKVLLGDLELWKHSDDSSFSLKKLSLDLPSNKFSVMNSSDESKEVTVKASVDVEKTESTDQFHHSSHAEYTTFQPRSGFVFTKVSHGTSLVWESTDGVFGTLVRTKTTHDGRLLAVLLTNHSFKFFNEESGQWKDLSDSRRDVSKLKFLGENDAELTSSHYKVMLVDLLFTYSFNPDVDCRKVKYGNEFVWKNTDDKNFQSMKSLSLDLPNDKFFVKNSSNQTKQVGVKVALDVTKSQSTSEFHHSEQSGVVTFTPTPGHMFSKVSHGTDPVWESLDVCSTLVRTKTVDSVKFLAVLMTNNMFKLFKLEEGKFNDVTSKRHDVKMLRFLGENDVDLMLSDFLVTVVDLSYKFTFKDGVKCLAVKYSNRVVWRHTDDPSFGELKSLQLDLPTNRFLVKNSSGESKELNINVGLDLTTSHSTGQFNFNEDSGVVTFSPKPGYVFYKVSDGPKDVWESTDAYGTLAMTKSVDDKKFLGLLLENSLFKVLHLVSGEWQDLTASRRDVSKLKFLGDNDSELAKTSYDVSLHDLSYTFSFKSGANCKKVTYSDVPMWTHTDDPKFSSLKSLSLDLPKDKFFVKNSSDEKKELTVKLALDVNATQSTTEFMHSDKDGFVTFTPKPDHLFTKLSDDTTHVWDSKNSVFATMVMTKSMHDGRYLALLLTDNKFELYHHDGTNWKNLTSKRHDVTKLKLYADNNVELKSTDYTLTLSNLSFTYTFKAGVNCRKVRHGNDFVWTYNDDKSFQSLKSFSLNLPSNRFYVTSPSDDTKEVAIKANVDVNSTQNTDECLRRYDHGVATYTPNPGYVFAKISQGTTTVWNSRDNVYATLLMTKTVGNQKYLAVLMDNNTFKFFNEVSNKFTDTTSSKRDVSKLKFLADSDVELTASEYSVSLHDLSFTYSFNDGVKFHTVKYDERVLWKHTDDPEYAELKSLSLDLPNNKFSVKNFLDQTKEVLINVTLDLSKTRTNTAELEYTATTDSVTYAPKDGFVLTTVVDGTKVVWESSYGLFSKLVRTKTVNNVKFLVVLLEDNMFLLFHLDGGDWHDVTGERHDVNKLKFLGDNDVELSKTDYAVSLLDLSYTYTFKANVKCRKVMLDDLDVWTYSDDTKFAELKSLSLDLPKNQFSVMNTSNNKKELTLKVALDVNANQSTDQFDFTDHNGVVTYTPKSDHMFSKVVDGTKVVFQSTDAYGTLVMTKTVDDKKFLAMLLTDKLFKLFHLDGNEWKDVTSSRHDVKKLKFFGDNDVELASSLYDVTLHDLSYRYTFKTNARCKKVKHDGRDVWKHDDDAKFSELTTFSLDLPKNQFFANSSEQTRELTVKVSLDVNASASTNEFDYSTENNFHTFTGKGGHVFSKVVKGSKEVFQSTGNVHASLVRATDDQKFLVVLLTNKMFKVFQLDDNDWKDVTSDVHDVTKLKFFGDADSDLTVSDFSVSLHDLSYEFLFKSGVNCRKVMLGDDRLVWSHSDDSRFESMKSLSLDLFKNKFFVKNSLDQSKQLGVKVTLDAHKTESTDYYTFNDQSGFFTFKPNDDHVFNKVSHGPKLVWESTGGLCSKLVRTNNDKNYLVVLLTNNMFKLFRNDQGDWEDLTSKRHDVSLLRFFGDNDAQLSSSDFKVTLVDYFYRFTFNSGVKCLKVTFDNMPLWRHTDDSSFGELKSLHLDLPTNKLFVKNTSDQSKELVKPTTVSLDLEKTESSDEFEYSDQNGVVTFTAKPSHVFSKVVEGPKAVWESSDDVFGTMVMTKDNEGVRYLALLLDNHLFKVFKEDASKWKDVTLNRPDVSRLKFLGDNDAVLKPSDYTVSLSNFSFTYHFNSGVNCKKVLFGDSEVWKDSEDPKFSSLKSFSLGLCSKRFYVKNLDNQCKRLPFEPKPAKETSAPAPSPTNLYPY